MGTKNLNNATDLITFTRASGGTALRKISYGSEMVTNGTFDTDLSGWNAESDWTYSNGKAALLANSLPNQTLVSPTAYVEAGKKYRVRFDASSSVGTPVNTMLKLRVWGDDNGTGLFIHNGLYINTGSHERFITPTANGYVSFDNVVSSNFDKFIDNVSIKEVLFDQPDGILQLYNHDNNVPRIEYDADGAVKGLLIEEARTNYYTTSEDTWNAYGRGSHVKTVDTSVVNPSGAYGSDKITQTNDFNYSYVGYHPSYATIGNRDTYSVYLKSAGHNYVRLRMSNMGGAFNYDFDLSNGTSILPDIAVNSGGIGHMEDVGNGWWRCSLTYTATVLNPYPSVFMMPSMDTYDIGQFQGDGTSGVYMWGHQIETGSFPTSYIPTTGATATRAADFATIVRSTFGHHEEASTFIIEFTPTFPEIDTNQFLLDRYGSGDDFQIRSLSPNKINAVYANVGSESLDITANQTSKFAAVVKDGERLHYCIDGGTIMYSNVVVNTTPFVSGVGGYTNQDYRLGGNQLGHIKSVKYYPRGLTNTQLQELTT